MALMLQNALKNWDLYIFSTLRAYMAISEKGSVRKVCI